MFMKRQYLLQYSVKDVMLWPVMWLIKWLIYLKTKLANNLNTDDFILDSFNSLSFLRFLYDARMKQFYFYKPTVNTNFKHQSCS